MTPTQLYEFMNYTRSLFPKWKASPEELKAFADGMQNHPFDKAKEAVKVYYQTTTRIVPRCASIDSICRELRFGKRPAPVEKAAENTITDRQLFGLPDDAPEWQVVVARHAAWREKAAILYGEDEGRKWYLANGWPRVEKELVKAGVDRQRASEMAQRVLEEAKL